MNNRRENMETYLRKCFIAFICYLCFSMCCWGGLGKQDELKLNGTNNLLVHADDINLMCEQINTMQRNTESLKGTSRDVGLVVNPEES